MIDHLGKAVVLFNRKSADSIRAIEDEFHDFGLVVLGPTFDQVERCAEWISRQSSRTAKDLATAVPDLAILDVADDFSGLVAAYRRIFRPSVTLEFFVDRYNAPGKGAKNDQSIVVKVEADSWAALLPGDMQLAAAEVDDDLQKSVDDLLAKIRKAGPYDLVKTPHHTSYNGLLEPVYEQFAGTPFFAHSGGKRERSRIRISSARRAEDSS